MAKYQAIGQVHYIGPTQTIPSKSGDKTYTRRQLVISQVRRDPDTDALLTPNLPQFEVSGQYCAILDSFTQGKTVLVKFDINGRSYTGDDGELKYFTTLRAFHIEPYQRQTDTAHAQPAAQPAQEAAPAPVSAPAPAVAPAPAPTAPAEGQDDLPF